MPSLVYSSKVKGPATHAVVIGVGHYPHLPGGAAKDKIPNPEGLTQLKSPPASARQVARWLIENYTCDRAPLASVQLLISERDPSPFVYKKNKAQTSAKVETATMAEITKAVRAWRKACDADPGCTALFYFCGHGLAAGTELALLAADFGADQMAPLKGAIDFRHFHRAMDECSAREQVYFIDACRAPSELMAKNEGLSGDPIFNLTGNVVNPGGRPRLGPIFHSTLAGTPAYAQPKKASLFTQALIEALAGAGSGDEDGPWLVKTTRLQESLDFLMRAASIDLKMPQAQIASSDNFAYLTLNTVTNPTVPVVVRVERQAVHELATLRCENTTIKKKRAPGAKPWKLPLPAGTYSFFADVAAGKFKVIPRLNETVRPPYWGKALEVK